MMAAQEVTVTVRKLGSSFQAVATPADGAVIARAMGRTAAQAEKVARWRAAGGFRP